MKNNIKKKILMFGFNLLKLLTKKQQHKLLIYFRFKDNTIALYMRYLLVKCLAKSCGEKVFIKTGVYLLGIEGLEIGNNVSIHPLSYIDASGGVYIGDDVSIAHNVTIMSSSHRYSDINKPIKQQGLEYNKTIIENNVWIGAKTTILMGITIGSRSIIGANSIITKSISKNSIAVGNPGRIIKSI